MSEQPLPRWYRPSPWGSRRQCWNLRMLSSLIHPALLFKSYPFPHVVPPERFGKCCYEGWLMEMRSPNQDRGTSELSWGSGGVRLARRFKVFVYSEKLLGKRNSGKNRVNGGKHREASTSCHQNCLRVKRTTCGQCVSSLDSRIVSEIETFTFSPTPNQTILY